MDYLLISENWKWKCIPEIRGRKGYFETIAKVIVDKNRPSDYKKLSDFLFQSEYDMFTYVSSNNELNRFLRVVEMRLVLLPE